MVDKAIKLVIYEVNGNSVLPTIKGGTPNKGISIIYCMLSVIVSSLSLTLRSLVMDKSEIMVRLSGYSDVAGILLFANSHFISTRACSRQMHWDSLDSILPSHNQGKGDLFALLLHAVLVSAHGTIIDVLSVHRASIQKPV